MRRLCAPGSGRGLCTRRRWCRAGQARAGPLRSAASAPAVYAADGGDRQVPILFRLASPQVQLFQQLLTDDECDALVALSRGRLARSPVVNPDTGDENLIDARTSMGAMFQVAEHALIARIEARIAAVTGVPAEHGEGLQILNYKPGGEYQPHFDYFNPQRPGEARQLSVGGQRIATLVIYLNTPEAGGATAFPRVGLEVAPVKGNAVYFSYRLPTARWMNVRCTPACRWHPARNGSPPNGCANDRTAARREPARGEPIERTGHALH